MFSLHMTLASFLQLARHWQQGEVTKLEMSYEARSLNIQLNAKLRHPDLLCFHHPSAPPCKRKSPSQLRRQERRRHAVKTNAEEAKSTHNLGAEDFAPSNEAEEQKELFLEHENPQYSSDISPKINTEKQSQLFKLDHFDFVNIKSWVNHHHQCDYCNLKNMFSDIMKAHIHSNYKNIPSTHIIYFFWNTLSRKKDFENAHNLYDPKFTKCLLITRIFTRVVYAISISL